MARTGPLLLATIAVCFFGRVNGAEYLGKFLGQLSQLHHGVSGEVYAVDGRTLHIKDFTYDGQGPAAYFYASTYKTADSRGFRLRDENNNGDVIRRYRKEHVTLTLPEGKTLNNIKIFYVWCEEFDVNFGDVKISRNFDFPRPQKIDALKGVHSISSDNIVIVDAQTLLIPNLHYDGEAPDAKFWVGKGPKPSPQGIRVPDENGKEVPLRRYDGKTVVLTLPGDLTVFDIGHFGIWCEQFTVDFGHIQIPQILNIPPSLKMLGVSPQSKLNCEVLNDEIAFEVRWAVAGESIVLQLVGKLDNGEYMSFGLSGDDSKAVMIGGDVVVAWVDKETLKGYAQDYYLGDKSQCSGPTGSCPDIRLGEHTNNIRLLNAAMVNGYSIVTYQRPLKASDEFDLPIHTNQSQAIIWAIGPLNQRDEVSFHSSYLKRDSLIDFARPANWNCPLPEGENVRKTASIENRKQHVVSDEVADPISTEPIQPEPAELSTTSAPRREGNRRRGGGTRISTRQPISSTDEAEEGQATIKEPTRTRGSNRVSQRGTQLRTVPPPTPVKNRNAWYIPPIQCYEPEDGVFYAQMGPTGGKRGYPAITGHVGWGISWYINGLLIPEINVVRGKAYTFVVEGGNDPEVSAKYHPFYITDDPVGGYAYKTLEEQQQVRILAGARFSKDGAIHPTGTGRLCHWTNTGDSEADDFDSFGAYQRTLQLKCDAGEPGFIQWTPGKDTPDTVYYQCFTHRYLGWKINVLDSCDVQGAASEPKPSIVEAPERNLELFSDKSSFELEGSASIQQEIRVIPNNIITEENSSGNKKSQPTVSEILTTLDPPTPTSQLNPDKIPNTSFLFQSLQQNHPIETLGQSNNFALPYDTSGYYDNYNNDASSFRPSPTIDNIEDFSIKNPKQSVVKRMTTTEYPLANFLPQQSPSNLQTDNNTNFAYIPLPLNVPSKLNNIYFKKIRLIKHPLQLLQMPSKQTITNSQNLQHPTILNQLKRPFFGIIPQKIHTPVFYNIQPEFNHNPNFKISQNKQQFLIHTLKVSDPTQTQFISETVPKTEIKNVEISPQQSSTQREPEIQTANPLISIHPMINENFKIPSNTGFNPGSVIIERGFKPIISKNIEDRVDHIEPEVDLEGQIGVIEVNGTKFEKHDQDGKLVAIFMPSTHDEESKQKHQKTYNKLLKKDNSKIMVQPRSLIDSDIELEMAAADKVESFYLPPPGQTDRPKTSAAKQPSEIDFDTPLSNLQTIVGPSLSDFAPDTVVTYDGIKVSGASLTAKPFEKSTLLEQRGSKATELIKAYPQSVPFRGDLPPLSANVLFDIKSRHPNTHPGVLSRNLDTPLPPSSGSTKLTRVRRLAHHTPEHIAQQMRHINETKNNSTTSGSKSLMQTSSLVSLVFSMALIKTFI